MEKDPENNPNSEDKDYGFPFVKVEPLSGPSQNEAISPITEVENISEVIDSLPEDKPEPVKKVVAPQEIPEKREKSNSPLLISLVLVILVVLGAMAYFLYYLPNEAQTPNTSELVEEQIEETVILPETATDEIEEVIQDSVITEAVETPPSEVPAPVIATASGGKLIVVDGKENVRSYHLVVASLPNERIAREEAQVFLDKGKDIWLIFPSGDTRNYRLSVGKYSSFQAATEDLAAAKSDFNESTWILKY